MPHYVVLINYTEQGVRTFKDLSKRMAESRQAAEGMGAKLHSYYVTMGHYDAVAIGEAPDDETMAALVLGVGARGNVRTQTLRAFTEEEAAQLGSRMP
jgi:uncharacterized protein with GYD domain